MHDTDVKTKQTAPHVSPIYQPAEAERLSKKTAPPTCQNTKLLGKPTRFHTGAELSLLCGGTNLPFFSLQRAL